MTSVPVVFISLLLPVLVVLFLEGCMVALPEQHHRISPKKIWWLLSPVSINIFGAIFQSTLLIVLGFFADFVVGLIVYPAVFKSFRDHVRANDLNAFLIPGYVATTGIAVLPLLHTWFIFSWPDLFLNILGLSLGIILIVKGAYLLAMGRLKKIVLTHNLKVKRATHQQRKTEIVSN